MICPNCFFENSDEIKNICPFCNYAFSEQSAETAPETTLLRRTARTHSSDITPSAASSDSAAYTLPHYAEPMYTPREPNPPADMDSLITTYHGHKIPSEEAETTPAVNRSKRLENSVSAKKKNHLPVWAQISIWVAGIAVIAVSGYYFSLYASNNINGWTRFWVNIFSSWR